MRLASKGRRGVSFHVFPLLLVLACANPTASRHDDSKRISVPDGWLAMGTFFEADLRVEPDQAERARAWLEWARIEITRLEKIYSRHDPQSAVSSLNRALIAPHIPVAAVHLDSELEAILLASVEVWKASEGAFDITVGPLVDVWTKATATGKWPSVEQLDAAKRRVGSERLLLAGDGHLGLTTRGMRIDLDGISKGAVLDRLRESLESDLPDAAALLNFGESSVLAVGDPDGDGWRLLVRSQEPSNGAPAILRLRDQALSASSSIGSVSEIGGDRVSHIIDPRTGGLVEEPVEAIVIADRAEIADGWSTALLVVGANRNALRLVEKAGVDASVFDGSGRGVVTAAWDSFLHATD